MIELLQRFYSGARAFAEALAPPARDAMSMADISGVVTAAITGIAVIVAAWALWQNAQSRNLAIIVEITRQLSEMRERMNADGLFKPGANLDDSVAGFRAYQMLHLLEGASFLINKGLATGKAKNFLLEWLEVEVGAIESNPAYMKHIEAASAGELSEFKVVSEKLKAKRKAIAEKAANQLTPE